MRFGHLTRCAVRATRNIAAALLAGLLLLPAGAAQAADVTLGRALALALANNEDIKESFSQIGAAKGRHMASKGPYDLNVFGSYRYGAFNDLNADDYPFINNAAKSRQIVEVGLRQRIPTGGTLSVYYSDLYVRKLGLAGGSPRQRYDYVTLELSQSLLRGFADMEARGAIEKALLAVQDSEQGQRLMITQVIGEVTRDYWALKLARHNLDVAREVYNMAEEVLRREQARYSQDLSLGVDLDRARTAREQRRLTILEYERDIEVLEERLRYLLNVSRAELDDIIPVTEPGKKFAGTPDFDASLARALEKRPELRQLRLLLQQLGIDLKVNRNKLLPSVDLVFQYRTRGGVDYVRSAEDFKDTDEQGSWFAGVTANFPLQNREARGNLEYSKQVMRVAQSRIVKMTRSIEAEVRDSLTNIELARLGIPVARKAYEAAIRTNQGEMQRFELFQANNRDLLTSQETLAHNKMLYYKSIIDYNLAKLSHEIACGTLLDSYAVVIGKEKAFLR